MVYVGELFASLKSRKWPFSQACHLFMDAGSDLSQLHQVATRIGLRPAWFQNHAMMPHYDLTEGKRYQALKNGAMGVDRDTEFECIQKWREFRTGKRLPAVNSK